MKSYLKIILGIVILIGFMGISSCFLDNNLDSGVQQEISKEEYNVFNTTISGLSGMCFSQNGSTFLAVSDKTGIYELSKKGDVTRKLFYAGTNDFEAITINPTNGNIYLAGEGKMKIYLLSGNELSIETITDISISNAIFNKGIEGLSFGNDTLYITNQEESPTLMIKYDLISRKEVSRQNIGYAFIVI